MERNQKDIGDDQSLQRVKQTVEIDYDVGRWMIFDFAKRPDAPRSIEKSYRTVREDGSTVLTKIQVESINSELDNWKHKSEGLPGALSQDVLYVLLDKVIEKFRQEHISDFAKIRNNELSAAALDEISTVYFSNSQLCRALGLSESHPNIGDAIKHLSNTKISAVQTEYDSEGKPTVYTWRGSYIDEYATKDTTGNNLHSVKFNRRILLNIVSNLIGVMDRTKLMSIPSGAPRRLYALLAATRAKDPTRTRITIPMDEIYSQLNLSGNRSKRYVEKYLLELKKIGVISAHEFSFAAPNPIKMEMLTVFLAEQLKLNSPLTQKQLAEIYCNSLREEMNCDSRMARIADAIPNITPELLSGYMEKYPGDQTTVDGVVPKVLYWADQLIWGKSRGSRTESVNAVLKHCLINDEPPNIPQGYRYVDRRLRQHYAAVDAEKAKSQREQEKQREDATVKELSNKILAKFSPVEIDRLVSSFDEAFSFYKTMERPFKVSRILTTIQSAIRVGIAIDTVSDLTKFIAESELNESVKQVPKQLAFMQPDL